jgi:hypothetical protein
MGGSRAAFLAVAIGLLALVVGCGSPQGGAVDQPGQTTQLPSGLRGTVLLCPGPPDPESTAQPCDTPYKAQLAILDGDGNVVTRVTSGDDGHFQVDLAPGEYTLAPQNGDPYPTAQSMPVIVMAGEYTDIQVNYDNGQ